MNDYTKRLLLKEIDATEQADNCTVKVALSFKDQIFTGEASGSSQLDSQRELAIQATLAAVKSALAKPFALTVKGINITEIAPGFPELLLVVVIGIEGEDGEMVNPGSCRSAEITLESLVKATLDATNRLVEVHLAT